MLAPAVILARLPIMAAEAAANASQGRETRRAVTEKTTAAAQGLVAAQVSLAHAMWSFWPEVLSGRVPSLLDGTAARQASDAALRPAGRRVRANHRRLTKV
jgi:hypothetical protein